MLWPFLSVETVSSTFNRYVNNLKYDKYFFYVVQLIYQLMWAHKLYNNYEGIRKLFHTEHLKTEFTLSPIGSCVLEVILLLIVKPIQNDIYSVYTIYYKNVVCVCVCVCYYIYIYIYIYSTAWKFVNPLEFSIFLHKYDPNIIRFSYKSWK